MATSNAELQAEIDRIMRMAVRREPVDLRYDVNKDGRISSRDAYLVMSGAATIPPPPAPAPVVQQPWWVGQFASEADANFVDTNRNQQIEETERAAAAEQERLIQEQLKQQTEKQNLIKSNFVNIYNNNNLTTQQKAQQINQFAQQNNISRDEIASAMNLGANDLNAFLDTDPAIVQNRVNNLLQIVNSSDKPEDFTYETDYEGTQYRVLSKQGIAAKQARADAGRQLEALGYELFDPDGPEYNDEYGSYNTAPAKWLSPQEAASVTGTKINNQLRNQAYVQSTDYLASQLSPLANQLRQRLDAVNASGKLVANQPARYYNEVANRLTQRTGITDLNDVGVREIDVTPLEVGNGDFPSYTVYVRKDNGQHIDSPNEIYNKKTGQVYGYGYLNVLGTFGNKQDETSALLRVGPDGNLKLDAGYAYEQEAWKDVVTALAPIALNFVPGVGQFLGAAILPAGTSAAIQTAVGNAVLKAGIDVATGVPLETALKNGLVSVGINQGLPNLSGNAYIDNAVKAVSVAALTGGDVEAALVNSVISTGGKEALGNVSLTGDKVVDSAIASAVTSGLSAAATGGDVGASVAQGFGSGLSAGINTQNQVTTIPGIPAQTITGAAGNDSIPAGVGVDTVGGIAGADTVNAGVAENDVLDLIQRDIDTSVANNVQDVSNAEQEVQPVAPVEPGIDPRILAQGVTDGQFGEGGFLQTGGNIGVNVLPPNPQSEFGVQKNINARADFNESSLGAKYGEINSPHWGKLISSIMINDVVDANGNPIDTPVGYYAIYDPDTKSTFYEFSLSDGTTVTSKTRPFVEQGKIFSEDKFYELKPSRQRSELNIDTGAGNGAFLGETQDLAEEPTAGITVSASKPTIDQRLLDLVEQAPDQESATNATVAYYQALDNDLSDDEALNAAKTAMQAKSPEILFDDSIVEQQPNEQQVADTELTVVDQPVNQTPVVSPTTPSVTPPTIAPVVTEPVVTEPVVTQPSVTQPVVSEPVAQQPTSPDIVTTTPSITQPAQKTELQAEIEKIMRMAVKKEAADLRYDVNKDGRVNVQDALLVYNGQATIPTAEEYAAQQSASPSTAPSTTPQVTQPVDQTPATTAPSTGLATSTGVVLQNNGDGTALVLTNDGNATNVPATDARSNEPLTPGSSVTIDQNTNTATATPPASDGGAQAPIVSAPPTVQDTGGQQVLGGGQQPTTDAGSIIDTTIGPDISTPTVPEPVVEEPVVQEPPSPPPPPPAVPTTPEEPITEPPQEPVVDKTEEDLLLEQIIRELEPTPPVSEGVPIPEPVFPEPPLVLPESPTINVGDRLTVRPVVDRGYRRPSVSPGSRVEESAQILPLRPGLSEGGTGGIEGTTEQEQEPVWNVRSLKLRRLLGI